MCGSGCVDSCAERFPYVKVAGCVNSVLLMAVRVSGMCRHEEKVCKCELVSRWMNGK